MSLSTHRQSGFTLLEIMVAVAILAMISVLSWQSMLQMMNSQELTETRDTMLHGLRITSDKLFSDLTQAFLAGPSHKGIKQTSLPAFIGGDGKLDFATFSGRRYFPGAIGGDQSEVGYYLETDPDDASVYLLMRRESELIDDKPEEGGKAFPLLEHIKQLQIEFYDLKKKEWRTEWNSTQLSNHDRLPHAVRVTITLEERERGDVTGESVWTLQFPVPLSDNVLDF